jgi:hypothetical protein
VQAHQSAEAEVTSCGVAAGPERLDLAVVFDVEGLIGAHDAGDGFPDCHEHRRSDS